MCNIPAGHVDSGEALEAAAIREVKEETGFDVAIERKLSVYRANGHTFHPFQARIVGGDLTVPAEEILDIKWLSFGEVKKLNETGKMRSFWQVEAIKSVELAL